MTEQENQQEELRWQVEIKRTGRDKKTVYKYFDKIKQEQAAALSR